MSAPPSLALADFFRLLKPTHVLGTSYTLSLAFFEALVFPRIDRSALRRCLLLADRHGFRSALVEAAALRGVGRDYMAACVPCGGSFHPKVWILVGEDEAAVLAGSGNLTRSGFMDNAELFDAVHLKKGGPHRAVAEGLVAFLDGLRGQWSAAGDRDLLVLDSLAEMRDALTGLARDMPHDPDPKVRFLSNYPQPLVEQIASVMGGGTLHVAAPYFGGSVAAVEELRTRLKPKKVKVYPAVHGDETLDVPLKKLGATPGVSAHRLALGDGRFAHLKLYGSDAPGGCWLFTTSANCTVAALGGENVEAGLLRSVSKATLRSYFAEDDGAPLPTAQRPSDFAAAARWLPLCAADRGAYIELTASGEADLRPLRDVELIIAFGGESHRAKRTVLFATGAGEHVSWDLFPKATRRTDAPPLLSLRGKSPTGAVVEGAAFVDQPLLLTSEPAHRSAWRATLALLDGEGHPDGADLACVFHLFGDVFETTTTPPAPQGGTGGSHAPEPAAEDRLAIWPPVTHAAMPAGFRHGHGHPVQWFQRILSGLMGPRSTDTQPGGSSGGSTAVPDDEAGEVAPPVTVSRAAVSLWEYAGGSFDDLLERLQRMEPTAENSRKVWPVSIAILLVTLATRRQLAQNVAGLKLPGAGELADRFLGATFGNRSQPWRHRMSDADGRATDGSVAAELRERFGAAPSDDIADVLLLLFAFQRARALRSRARFFLNGWLAFREIAPGHHGGAPPAGSETIFRRYLDEGPGVATWEEVVASLSALPGVDWPEHPGYRNYDALATQAAAGVTAEPASLPEHLRDGWDHTRRRMKTGKPWHQAVANRFRPCCCADRCPMRDQVDRDKGALADFMPVTCRGCGVVLVPARLLKEYEARHARSS